MFQCTRRNPKPTKQTAGQIRFFQTVSSYVKN